MNLAVLTIKTALLRGSALKLTLGRKGELFIFNVNIVEATAVAAFPAVLKIGLCCGEFTVADFSRV